MPMQQCRLRVRARARARVLRHGATGDRATGRRVSGRAGEREQSSNGAVMWWCGRRGVAGRRQLCTANAPNNMGRAGIVLCKHERRSIFRARNPREKTRAGRASASEDVPRERVPRREPVFPDFRSVDAYERRGQSSHAPTCRKKRKGTYQRRGTRRRGAPSPRRAPRSADRQA